MRFLKGSSVKPETEKPLTPYYEKKNVGEDQNKIIRYASQVSGNDLDFIATLEAENGLWSGNRISARNGDGSRDYGLCQLNSHYHWGFITSAGFADDTKQIDYCLKIYNGRPSSFYGYWKRNKMKSRFILINPT